MKTRTNVYAGMTFAECDQTRNYWKKMAQSTPGSCYTPPTPGPTPPPSPTPPLPPQPSGGGWVGGVWYPDRSGACG